MNARIFLWSLTSALAGFLFGFDTVVISGAEKTIQSLWALSPGLHGIAMASALYGTVVGFRDTAVVQLQIAPQVKVEVSRTAIAGLQAEESNGDKSAEGARKKS